MHRETTMCAVYTGKYVHKPLGADHITSDKLAALAGCVADTCYYTTCLSSKGRTLGINLKLSLNIYNTFGVSL